jgi:CxxC motif-containing protein (DUF1111 family)
VTALVVANPQAAFQAAFGVGDEMFETVYLHDGRATTLTETILERGGEAATSRTNFQRLSTPDQADVIAVLDNLVLFRLPED